MAVDILSQKSLVERYLSQTLNYLATHSFVNIFVWQDFFKFEFCEIDDNLCIFASDCAGTFLYLPPLGKNLSPLALTQCFAKMQALNKGRGLTRIENVSQEQLIGFSGHEYKIFKKGYEYLYYKNDLISLKGDAFKSKRNACNHFAKEFFAVYRPYEKSMADECFALYDAWDQDKRLALTDQVELAMLDDNKIVHRRALSCFAQLDLVGRVVEVAGEIVAYTFGYFINPQTFCDFLEITNKNYRGLGEYVFHQFCQDPALGAVKFINVMDDFALQNVKVTKLSFRPAVLLPTYTISPHQ